jgi:hypothetical protein
MDLIGIGIAISIGLAGIITLAAYILAVWRNSAPPESKNPIIWVQQQDPMGMRYNQLNRASEEALLSNGVYATRFNETRGRFVPITGRVLTVNNLKPNVRRTPPSTQLVVFKGRRKQRSRRSSKF